MAKTAHEWAETIGKLLAKAERTENEHERDAFSAQAERLMLKWGIEEAMARAVGGADVKPEEIVTKKLDFSGVGSTYSKGVILAMYSVARGAGIDAYRGGWEFLYLVGHESDVARAETLINSLFLQMTSARDTWWKLARQTEGFQYLSEHQKWKTRMNFMVSFGEACGTRLRKMNREETEAVPGAALVLRDRKAEVRDYMESKNLKSTRGNNFGGSAAGALAGQKASLGESGIGGRRSLGN